MRLLSRFRVPLAAALPGIAALVAVGLPAAHSQVLSVYGMFNLIHATSVDTGSVYSNGTYTEQQTSFGRQLLVEA